MNTSTGFSCPFWCQVDHDRICDDEAEDVGPIRHHEREVATLPATFLGEPYKVRLRIGSTEQATLSPDGVGVTCSPPATWVTVENLKNHDAVGLDLDPEQARDLDAALHKAVDLAESNPRLS